MQPKNQTNTKKGKFLEAVFPFQKQILFGSSLICLQPNTLNGSFKMSSYVELSVFYGSASVNCFFFPVQRQITAIVINTTRIGPE